MLPFLSAFDGLHISMAPEELFAPEASSQAQTTAASGKKNKKNKKNKKKAKNSAPPPPDPPTTPSTPTPSSDNNDKKKKKKTGSPSIVLRFDTYFGSGALSDWQRLCRDVGLEGEYPSKNQCRKVSLPLFPRLLPFLLCLHLSPFSGNNPQAFRR